MKEKQTNRQFCNLNKYDKQFVLLLSVVHKILIINRKKIRHSQYVITPNGTRQTVIDLTKF